MSFQQPDALPLPSPLPEAVAAGVFGREETGPCAPDEEQVYHLVESQALELAHLLVQGRWLSYCREHGLRPHSGKLASNPKERKSLPKRIDEQLSAVQQSVADCLEAYSGGFGYAAAEELLRYVEQRLRRLPEQELPEIQQELFGS